MVENFGARMTRVEQSVNALYREMSKRDQEALANQYRQSQLEFLTIAFDKSATYSNVIIVAGYAGAFATWGYVKQDLSHIASLGVALCFCVSLVAFVGYEVFKMILNSQDVMESRNLVINVTDPAEFLRRRSEMAHKQRTRNMKVLGWIWICHLVVAVGFALAGFGLLLWTLVAGLVQALT